MFLCPPPSKTSGREMRTPFVRSSASNNLLRSVEHEPDRLERGPARLPPRVHEREPVVVRRRRDAAPPPRAHRLSKRIRAHPRQRRGAVPAAADRRLPLSATAPSIASPRGPRRPRLARRQRRLLVVIRHERRRVGSGEQPNRRRPSRRGVRGETGVRGDNHRRRRDRPTRTSGNASAFVARRRRRFEGVVVQPRAAGSNAHDRRRRVVAGGGLRGRIRDRRPERVNLDRSRAPSSVTALGR